MFLMLVAAGALYLVMGSPGDALMLLGFVFVVMAITIVQERRTERALDALRDLSSPRALVIRGGVRRRIAGREVARGDILVLSEGDRVPADAILRRAINLSVDESLLTGESVPVRKTPSADAQALERPGGDDLPSVFSGTLVTAGQGIAEVVNTGGRTELGKIGKALQQIQPEPTSLQKETARLVRTLAVVGLAACGVVVVVYALTRGGTAQVWKEGLLAGIAMAMAILPEEFPVVLTIFLALGAWRISRSRVLTRRMPAIETLGAATVLCVDKTGTLTRNQMTLKKLAIDGRTADLGADVANLSEEFHALAGERHPGQQAGPVRPHGTGSPGGRRPAADADRTSSSRVVAAARVPAHAAVAGGYSGVEARRGRRRRRRLQGRSRGDRRVVPAVAGETRVGGGRGRGARGGRAPGARCGQCADDGGQSARRAQPTRTRVCGTRGPRRSAPRYGAGRGG